MELLSLNPHGVVKRRNFPLEGKAVLLVPLPLLEQESILNLSEPGFIYKVRGWIRDLLGFFYY